MKTRSILLVVVGMLLSSLPLLAADWPQWRGPDRTGVSGEKGLLQQWPKGGPKLLWKSTDCGLGFSGPAIVGDRLYTLGAHNEVTHVIALDVATGKEVWKAKLGPIYTFQGNTWGDGPRSTPTVDGGLIYALGGYGDLVCLKIDGTEAWRTHLAKNLGGEMMTVWGYSESPLVDGDKLVCCPGGAEGTVAALDKKTGKVLWRSKELKDKATYSSPMVAEFGGVRQYVVMTFTDDVEGSAIAGVAADDGRLLWYERYQKGASYAVAPTPIIQGNLIYETVGYGTGSRLFQITPKGKTFAVKQLYTSRQQKSVKNTHGGMVLVDGNVYGHSERLGWVCQELKSGKIHWEDKEKLECTSGAITAADGRLYLYSDQGTAVLLEPSTAGWQEKGQFTIPEHSTAPKMRPTSVAALAWTHPVVANGRLYLRDQDLLFCFDVRAAGGK